MSSGCSNSCQELAEKLCDRTSTEIADCSSVPQNTAKPDQKERACRRMRTVVANCKGLTETAASADDEDKRACKANLEMVRTLERSQM